MGRDEAETRVMAENPVKAKEGASNGPSGPQIKALLDDVERLTREVEDLRGRLERCSRATDDEKCRWWIRKYDELKASMKKNEFDQT